MASVYKLFKATVRLVKWLYEKSRLIVRGAQDWLLYESDQSSSTNNFYF